MESTNSTKVLMQLANVQVYRLLQKNQVKTAEGQIRLCLIEQQGVHFISVDSFFQELKQQMVFISIPFETQITYLIPHMQQGFFALIVSTADSQWTELNNAFAQLVTSITQESANANEQINGSIFTHCPTVLTTSIIEENKTAFFLNQGGSIFKSGLKWFGSVAAGGINKGGEYLSSQITNPKPVQVSEETQGKVENVKEQTKNILSATGDLLGKVIKPVADITNKFADEISEKIEKSDNSTVQYMKEVGKATVQFTNQAYDGLASGLKDVGSAISTSTQTVVEKQYGSDVTGTFMGGSVNHDGHAPHLNGFNSMEQNPNAHEYPPINEIDLSQQNIDQENLLHNNNSL